jgi:hypothetical protein
MCPAASGQEDGAEPIPSAELTKLIKQLQDTEAQVLRAAKRAKIGIWVGSGSTGAVWLIVGLITFLGKSSIKLPQDSGKYLPWAAIMLSAVALPTALIGLRMWLNARYRLARLPYDHRADMFVKLLEAIKTMAGDQTKRDRLLQEAINLLKTPQRMNDVLGMSETGSSLDESSERRRSGRRASGRRRSGRRGSRRRSNVQQVEQADESLSEESG